MTDIVLGRIFGAAGIEELEHRRLDGVEIAAAPHQIFLMQDMAEEMSAIHLTDEMLLEFGGKGFEPVDGIARQGDIEGDDILHFVGMNVAEADHRAADGEAVEIGTLAFLFRAFKVGAGLCREMSGEVSAGFGDAFAAHAQHQVVLVAVAIIVEAGRQVFRQDADHGLQQAVGDVAAHAELSVRPSNQLLTA